MTERDGRLKLVASSDIEVGDTLSLESQGSASLAATQGLPKSGQAPLGAEIQIAAWDQTNGMSNRCRRLLTSTFLISGASPIPRVVLKCVRKALRPAASSKFALEIATYQLLSEACRSALTRVMVLETSLDSIVQDSASLIRCISESEKRMEIEEDQFSRLAGTSP